jgi:Xaa-Pro aminopeptidase
MKNYTEDNSIAGRKAEINGKLTKVRASMAKDGLAGVLINKSEHFAWITAGGDNIVTRYSEGGICTILVTKDKAYYLCTNIEGQRMIDEEFLDQLGFEARVMPWYEDLTLKFAAEITGGGKLASDSGLPGTGDANPMLLQYERVLCENEIGRYLRMGKVFSEVIEGYMKTIRPGDTEKEITGRLGAKMWENGLEGVLFLIASDDRVYKYRHPIPTDKKVEKLLMISCNARYKGLITKITRMVYFGKAPDELKEQYRKTVEIENRIAAMTKPGLDDIETLEMSKKLYAEAGYPEMWKVHHQGGPQSYTNGFYLINPGKHETVQLHQIYGYNPSITGTKTEDAIVVTEEGPLFVTYPVYFPKLTSVIDGKEYVRAGILEIR